MKPGMTKPIARDAMYRRRVFDAQLIELCVRWYITYRLSYRDLVEMMAERGIHVAHTTIFRWVLRYVPEYEKRWVRFARPVATSWRVDETYVSIRGRWHYLYRAVDKHGKTIDFLLRADRGISAALAFFRKALASVAPRVPRKITLDGHLASRSALWLLRREHPCWRNVLVRTNRYLNNIVEQDHRAIKRRCATMAGFKSFNSAAVTIAGVELAHRIRKRQFLLSPTYRRLGDWSLKKEWAMALA
jgi:transposase-like protein